MKTKKIFSLALVRGQWRLSMLAGSAEADHQERLIQEAVAQSSAEKFCRAKAGTKYTDRRGRYAGIEYQSYKLWQQL